MVPDFFKLSQWLDYKEVTQILMFALHLLITRTCTIAGPQPVPLPWLLFQLFLEDPSESLTQTHKFFFHDLFSGLFIDNSSGKFLKGMSPHCPLWEGSFSKSILGPQSHEPFSVPKDPKGALVFTAPQQS